MERLSSIHLLRAAPDAKAKGEDQNWPLVPRFTPEDLTAGSTLAQLALQLFVLQKEARIEQWRNEKGRVRTPEEQRERDAERERILKPESYLEYARELLEQAVEHMKRPQSDAEFLVASGGDRDALGKVVAKQDLARRVPFKKAFDPDREQGDTEAITIPVERRGKSPFERECSRRTVIWPVYRSEKKFKEMFCRYADAQSKKWRETEGRNLESWVKGDSVPEGFPSLTEVAYATAEKREAIAEKWMAGEKVDGFPRFTVPGYDSEEKRREAAKKWIDGEAVPECFPPFTKEEAIKRRAETVRLAKHIDFLSPTLRQDLVEWNERHWVMLLEDWVRNGIPWVDFLAFYNFRKAARGVRLRNLRARPKGRKRGK